MQKICICNVLYSLKFKNFSKKKMYMQINVINKLLKKKFFFPKIV